MTSISDFYARKVAWSTDTFGPAREGDVETMAVHDLIAQWQERGSKLEELSAERDVERKERDEALVLAAHLRGRLIDIIGADADAADDDIFDLLADRLSGSDGGGPFSDAESALEEQIERLERDNKILRDALHITTGRRP